MKRSFDQLNNKTRIEYLDSIRGLAAMIVLFGHLKGAFYPAFSSELGRQPLLITIIDATPLSIFYNGFFAVSMFCLLSGYVISYQYFSQRDSNYIADNISYIASNIFRRYFRLTIPVFFSCLITYLLLKTNLFFNIKASQLSQSKYLSIMFNCNANFFNMIKFTVYNEYFTNTPELCDCYNNVLWVMSSLLLGAFGIYFFLAMFGRRSRRFRLILYTALIVLFHRSLYFAFVLGMILCDLDLNNVLQKISKTALFIILLIGIYFSSYKNYSSFYSILNINIINNHFSAFFLQFFYYIISAFLSVFVVSRSTFLKNVLLTKIPIYLGKISFSIYLLHFIVIGSLSSYIYIWFRNDLTLSYNWSFFITSAITILLTIILSHIFYNYIEARSRKWSKSLYDFVNRQEVRFMRAETRNS